MVHTLRLDNYYPTPRKLVLGTNSSFGTESIKIERGAGWDGLNLTATWHIPGREEPLRVALLDGDAMDVPPEVTKEAKDGVLVLAGLASGVQRASCNVEYLILEQAGVYGGADAEPTPELAAQVLEAVLQAKADAKAAAEDAAAAKANADKAQQAAENAAADAAKAGPYAEAARAAQEAAESARDKAIAAQQAAENAAAAAAASKSAADTLAAEAARAAQAAENSKAAANNAANLAGENATAAQQAADTATAAANDAGQSASDAAASKAAAETAAKTAQDAQTAAAEAKAEAINAQGAAQTAAKSAQDAQAAAEKARDDAKTAQQGAETARDAAAGSAEAAAKSEANAKQSADTLAESVENVVANTAAVAELKEKKAEIDDTAVGANAWSSKHIVDMLCPPLEESGDPVVCYPVAGYALGCKVNWEPTQEGSGTPSPENIRPIKGRDSVRVERCGENLIKYPTISNKQGIELSVDDNKLTIKGTCSTSVNITSDNIYLPDDTYTLSSDVLIPKGVFISAYTTIEKLILNYTRRNITGKVSGNTHMLIYLEAGTYNFTVQVSLVLGTTAPTTYTPYIGQTNTLTLPETVYGGEVDAVRGDAKETWKTINLPKTGWVKESTTTFTRFKNYTALKAPANNKDQFKNILCNVLQSKDTAYGDTAIQLETANDTMLIISVSGIKTLEDFFSFLDAYSVQVCYKLATSTPFTATGAQPIPALAGANIVLTDADSATVTGRADPIKRITDLEDAVASQT